MNRTSLGRIRLLGFLSAVALVFSAVTVFLLESSLVQDWENRFQSRFYLIRSQFSEPDAADLPLILVLIDDRSLPVNSPRSPIDREWLADLIDVIDKQHPTLIALNILLDRPGIESKDQRLKTVISRYGNVILRDDPFYPIYPEFSSVALDKGTLRFRLDSSDTIQEVCADAGSCRSGDIFFRKIIDCYNSATGSQTKQNIPNKPWLKINFSPAGKDGSKSRILSYPTIRAHEAFAMPEQAFKDKLVIIGAGFPDLYPLYRAPLSHPEIMLQETEVIAQILNMAAGESYLIPISNLLVGALVFALLLSIALVMVFRGIISSIITSVALILLLFIGAGWSFAFYNVELAFVAPVVMILLFDLTSAGWMAVRERFSRLTAELNLKQAKIDFLTNELHSHHLFNEFSRLSVMIRHDPKSAREYLVEFAEMLRSSLKYGDQKWVPVSVQIEYLNSYLIQQRMIFKSKLIFEFTKGENIETQRIPWHVFFPLVENAVKYTEGYFRQEPTVTAVIKINLEVSGSSLVFTVQNPFKAGVAVASSGTGLANLKDRLAWAYPDGGYLLDYSHDGQNWKAELTLPIQ